MEPGADWVTNSLYPEPETPSRPNAPNAPNAPNVASEAPGGMKRGLVRALVWVLGIAAFITGAAYAVLGRDFVRRLLQMRTRAAQRIETALQPPSQAEVAAARARDTVSAQLTERADAASLTFILAFLGAVLFAAFLAFYLTGRRREPR